MPIYSDKMRYFEPSVFIKMREAIADCPFPICDLSVGTPDLPPPGHVVDAFIRSASSMESYQYALADTPALVDAAVQWYARRFSVTLKPENICGLIGSQDGLAHLPLMLLNPGDGVLVPNPGYPMFLSGARLAGAAVIDVPLEEESGYLVDYERIPPSAAHAAKLLILSYPANPLGRLAGVDFFERSVFFAKKYGLYVLHDNAYAELVFDGARARSFLEAKGADEVGVEFNSLSKSYNLTGARISFMLGHSGLCAALSRLKSNIDYGIFKPVQAMAVAAVTGPQDSLEALRAAYQERRDALIAALAEGGWNVIPPQGTMFVWAKLPTHFPNSLAFALELLSHTGVAVVPGSSFGSRGEGYIRVGLVRPADELAAAARRVISFMKTKEERIHGSL